MLGPEDALDDNGEPLQLGAPRERAVLAWLAVRVPAVVSAGQLIAVLWGDDAPATAAKTVQTLIYRLRRCLPDGTVETVGAGYRLNVSQDRVDAHRFERLAREGSRLAASGEHDTAEKTLAAAIELWRGLPVTDLGTPLADAEGTRWQEIHETAIDDLRDVRVAAGDTADLIGDLEAAVGATPLRERRWGQLMLALYRSGRQADALAAYQRARGVLVDELGIEPGADLRHLERRILAQDPALDARPTDVPDDDGGASSGTVAPSDLVWTRRPSVAEFAGRADQVAEITDRWDTTIGSRSRRLVVVSGEAGIGKTRLAAEFAAHVTDAGGLVLHGRCDPDTHAPYQPFSEMLAFYAASTPKRVLREQCASHAAHLARVSPEIGERLDLGVLAPPVDPDSELLRVRNAVSHLVDEVAAGRPLLLVIDDLHWATAPTLGMLYHFLRDAADAGVLVVATARPLDRVGDQQRRAIAELHRTERVSMIRLDGLDPVAVQQMLVTAAGHELVGDMAVAAGRVHGLTGGNPFFVLETLRFLAESGAIVRDGDQWRLSDSFNLNEMPQGVREVLDLRLAQLDPAHVEVLRVAAVNGAAFDLRAVAAAVGHDVLDAVDAATATGLVREDNRFGRYQFVHDLLRQRLLADISSVRSTRLHWRIAEHLSTTANSDLDELAYHGFEGALAGDPAVAAGWMRAAAVAAIEGAAPDIALTHLDRALAVLDGNDPPGWLTADLLTDRAVAVLEAGAEVDDESFTAARTAAEHASIAGGDPTRIVRAHTLEDRIATAVTVGVYDERTVAAVEHAIGVLPGDATSERLLLRSYLAQLSAYGDDEPRRELVESVYQEFEELDSNLPRDLQQRVLMNIGLATMPNPAEYEWCNVAGQRLNELGDPLGMTWALSYQCSADLMTGDVEAATKRASLLLEAGQVFGSSVTRVTGAALAAAVAGLHGDLDTFQELRDTVLCYPPSPRVRRLHDALDYHLRCAVLDWTGHDDGTVGALLQGVGAFPKLRGVLYTAAAWAALVTGDDNTAKRLWDELRAEPVGAHARLTGRTVVPVYRYRLIERWGTRTEAEQGRANLEPLSGKWAGDPLLAL